MNDDEPSIVQKIIEYFYKLDYDDNRSSSSAKPVANPSTSFDPRSLLVNAKVYVIADKYELDALKELACYKYNEVLLGNWNTSNFSESVSYVYENTVETDRCLRDVIVRVASDNARSLLDRGDFVAMLKIHGDVATDIMHEFIIGEYSC